MVGCAFVVWEPYIILNLGENQQNPFDSVRRRAVSITFQVCLFLTALISFGLIIDSLLRVRRFSVGTLVISKKLMYYHFAAFGIFTLSLILGILVIHKKTWDGFLDP